MVARGAPGAAAVTAAVAAVTAAVAIVAACGFCGHRRPSAVMHALPILRATDPPLVTSPHFIQLRKYHALDFGRCPLVGCEGQPVVPVCGARCMGALLGCCVLCPRP